MVDPLDVFAVASDVLAATLADGCRAAISRARLGPVTTASRSGPTPATSVTTSLIRRPVPSSIPLARLTTRASAGTSQPDSVARSRCDGTASTTAYAPAIASTVSLIARSVLGSSTSGR